MKRIIIIIILFSHEGRIGQSERRWSTKTKAKSSRCTNEDSYLHCLSTLPNQWFQRVTSCRLIIFILASIGSQAAKTRYKPKYSCRNNKNSTLRYLTLIIKFVVLCLIYMKQLIVLTRIAIQCDQRQPRKDAREEEDISHPNGLWFDSPMSTCSEEIGHNPEKSPNESKSVECPSSRPCCIDIDHVRVRKAPLNVSRKVFYINSLVCRYYHFAIPP
mmetsp:Transcript_23677/g.47086  ORF Transcript_23677/g.47086 Transcript_23677/m.47086 type:complete len:216 (-) Transcript_23677:226-873(-)